MPNLLKRGKYKSSHRLAEQLLELIRTTPFAERSGTLAEFLSKFRHRHYMRGYNKAIAVNKVAEKDAEAQQQTVYEDTTPLMQKG